MDQKDQKDQTSHDSAQQARPTPGIHRASTHSDMLGCFCTLALFDCGYSALARWWSRCRILAKPHISSTPTFLIVSRSRQQTEQPG